MEYEEWRMGMGNDEWEMRNGKQKKKNREWGMGNRK